MSMCARVHTQAFLEEVSVAFIRFLQICVTKNMGKNHCFKGPSVCLPEAAPSVLFQLQHLMCHNQYPSKEEVLHMANLNGPDGYLGGSYL